jgi:AcrR family transcriptional regulator
VSGSTPRRRLGPQDWAAAALTALADGGLAAVAVEPLAARLGATKGSFYHHFGSRDELLRAALERWEQEHTVQVEADVEAASADPRAQLRELYRRTAGMAERDPVGLVLLGSAGHPVVAPVLARVTALRLDYLTRLFERLGEPRPTAHRRALLAYSTYLGHAQLAHATPGLLPVSAAARRAYLDLAVETLAPSGHVAGAGPASRP